MGIVAQYDVSAMSPSIVGGTGSAIKYFLNRSSIPALSSKELILPFGTPIGNRLEAYISGRTSAVGSVMYIVQANTNVNNVGLPLHLITLADLKGSGTSEETPFHIRLMFSVDSVVQGTYQSLVNGVFTSEKAMSSFRSSNGLFRFSLMTGVTFETSAEKNRSVLTEFKIVQV